MNHYPHHIGDFNSATRHLSRLERSIYRDCLDMYYDQERPLDGSNFDRLSRRLLCATPEEVEALQFVLDEFFERDDDCYVHHRCEIEIERFHASQKNGEQARNGERNRQKRHREERSRLFADLRAHGVSVPWNMTTSQLRELHGNTCHDPSRTCHAPDTANQNQNQNQNQNTPQTPQGGAPDGAGGVEPTFPDDIADLTPIETSPSAGSACTTAGSVCLAMKAAGIADTNPGNPKLRALVDAGADLQEFVGAAQQAVSAGNGRFAYVLGIVEGGRKRAAEMVDQLHRGDLPATETAYQRSMRERVQEFAPSLARTAPAAQQPRQSAAEFFNAIEVPARTVGALK